MGFGGLLCANGPKGVSVGGRMSQPIAWFKLMVGSGRGGEGCGRTSLDVPRADRGWGPNWGGWTIGTAGFDSVGAPLQAAGQATAAQEAIFGPFSGGGGIFGRGVARAAGKFAGDRSTA